MTTPTSLAPPFEPILERNLRVLAAISPRTAELVRVTPARPDVTFLDTPEGPSAVIGSGPLSRQLASRYAPLNEGRLLAETIAVEEVGAVVVHGFGLGYHVRELARRFLRSGVVVVFEPDVGLLRAVLERIDFTPWMALTNLRILTDAEDHAAMAAAVAGVEGIVMLGVHLLDHPASRVRLGGSADRFDANFTAIVRAARTTVLTTLVQVEASLRNVLMNAQSYTEAQGVADLAGLYAGRPAVVVSAGPSLARNLALLGRPGVRDRVVIVAVQTVLKTLLERGIRPHFVTALDYHEISRRFYEGLTAEDVRGVTLIAEAKANPAILDAFPGVVRCPKDAVLDRVIGPDLTRPMGSIPAGATVAHLAYYLARHMGCDPVVLIGQDLGFTDGQYYAAGAAIHTVWSGELNEFNTLEMMEWQRIVRGKRMLRKTTDVFGRPIYTDEQMATYLVQFERDFAADAARGLTTIDATEGGVLKRATRIMPLDAALATFAHGAPLPALPAAPAGLISLARRHALRQRLITLRRDTSRVESLSRKTADQLRRLPALLDDAPRLNCVIREVHALRDQVVGLADAYGLVQHLNQTGTFNRYRADRLIELSSSLSPRERQRRQIERDQTNVTWVADAAAQFGSMLDETLACLDGAPKLTRDPSIPDTDAIPGSSPSEKHRSIAAVILVEPDRSGLGTPRDLGLPFIGSVNPLRCTLARIARTRSVRRVVLLAAHPDRVRALMGQAPAELTIDIVPVDGQALGARMSAVGTARRWSSACWRGGIGGMSIFDEACCPAVLAPVMRDLKLDAAVIVGADWALLDPVLTDAVVDRHQERPDSNCFTFTQAAPGLAPCVIARHLADELAREASSAGMVATLGAMLSYQPRAPQADPIAKPVCVHVPPAVRDAHRRCIPDSPVRRSSLGAALATLGDRATIANASEVAAALETTPPEALPELLTLRLVQDRRCLEERIALRAIEDAAERPDAAITLIDDELAHPALERLLAAAARATPGGVHLRTRLSGTLPAFLIGSPPDVFSVDLFAFTSETYAGLTDGHALDSARRNLAALLSNRVSNGGIPMPFVVPRITRRDAVYEEIEPFFDHWLLTAGACIIDPLEKALRGERIAPLPVPAPAAARLDRTSLTIGPGEPFSTLRDLWAARVRTALHTQRLAV